mmetsp:Transcript_16399/g.55350  ORF Transcript_16399/g.55350 Transcript_16399/m.55350 type:complete len:278 (-) Transcript_16399:27-860(-)
MVRMGAARVHALRRRLDKLNKKEQLKDKLEMYERKREQEDAMFEAFFEEFDGDGSRHLDRAELTALMLRLRPHAPPTDEQLDRMLRSAVDLATADVAASGSPADADAPPVQKKHLKFVVLDQVSHEKEEQYIDNIFQRYDADNNGYLERAECLKLIIAIVHGDVLPVTTSGPEAQQAAGLMYKLSCLEALVAEGVLDADTYREKRLKIVSRHSKFMSPKLGDKEPDDYDMDFILAQCDADHDGKISRGECVAAISLWVRIVNQTEEKRHQSGACALM